eukprot:scaffold63219_cov33-Tisochrysis_lutea.AAC.9
MTLILAGGKARHRLALSVAHKLALGSQSATTAFWDLGNHLVANALRASPRVALDIDQICVVAAGERGDRRAHAPLLVEDGARHDAFLSLTSRDKPLKE